MNLFNKNNSDRTGAVDDGVRPRLTREVIIQASLRIVDNEGLEAFSMRRLGAELKANPMAVYYHFPNKSALLDGLVEAVMSEIDLTLDDPSNPVEERLRIAAHVYREVLLAHPHAMQVIAVRSPSTAASFRPVEFLLGLFRQAGILPTNAIAAVNIFAQFVRGVVLAEVQNLTDTELARQADCTIDSISRTLSPEDFPLMHEVMAKTDIIGCEAEFDLGVRALIRGLLLELATDEKSAKECD